MNKICPSCKKENEIDANFCEECGKSLTEKIDCPKCGQSIPSSIKFCSYCGYMLTDNATNCEISDFLKIEIEQAKIEGLGQKRIETNEFTLKDVEYLQQEGTNLVKARKPKLAATYFISAVKIIKYLNQSESQIAEYLRNYCAAKGSASVIENNNWDVARTYYSEVFRFSTNFVFFEKKYFDPKEFLKTQSEINLSLFLSTFHRSKETFLDKADWPIYNLFEILQKGNEKTIFAVLKALILLASFNPIIGKYMIVMATHKSEILKKLIYYFSKMYDKTIEGNEYEYLGEVIDFGISQIKYSTQELISQFRFYETNLSNFTQLREKAQQFLEWNPSFQDLGVDFLNTDSRYFEIMKTILRSIYNYDSSTDFGDKESKYLTTIQFITSLNNEITMSSTYWGRTYMQPLIKKWKVLLDEDFRKRDEQASPELLIESIERTAIDQENGRAELHVLVSNRDGTRSASEIKLRLLPSSEKSYELIENTYEIGSIRIGHSVVKVIYIKPITYEDRLSLSYQLSYYSKGREILGEIKTISVSLFEEPFEKFDNPYTPWSNASIVTDTNMFKGRTTFVNEIIDILKKVGKNKTIVIHGQKRSGKSSILYHVARKAEEETSINFLPIELDLGEYAVNKQMLDAPKFFHLILKKFEDALFPTEVPPIPPLDEFIENPVTLFISYLNKIYKLPKLKECIPLLIIDEFTYLYSMIKKGNIGENFMRAWKSITEKHLFSVLLAGTDDMPDFIKENANAFAATMPKYVSYLDEIGANELILDPIWDHTKNTKRLQDTAVKKIIQLTAGNPFYIQIVMDKLVNYMNKHGIGRSVTVADVIKVMDNFINSLQFSEAPIFFDNLTSFLSADNEETKYEKRVLQIIAYFTINTEFANKQSILQEFGYNEFEKVEKIIEHLLVRNVLKSQSGVQAYKIQVELFKLWLNEKMPYERCFTLKNPYIVGNPVTEKDFYSRHKEVEKILHKIADQSFIIDAEWRTGKTSLLFNIQYELSLNRFKEYYFIPVFISIDGCKEEKVWLRIAECLIGVVNKQSKIQINVSEFFSINEPLEYTFGKFKANFIKLTKVLNESIEFNIHKGKKIKFVLLIDEAQQSNNYSEQTRADFRNFLSQDPDTRPFVSSIFAGFKIERVAGSSSSPWTNFLQTIELHKLSDSEIIPLITDPIDALYKDRYTYEPLAIEKIIEYGQKIPYDTQVYCSLAFGVVLEKGISKITAEIVESIKRRASAQIYEGTFGIRGELNE